jgi:SAM-dependent methyltransferase
MNTTLSPALHSNWFNHWFDTSFYHSLYAHRDEKEAAGFIDALIAELNPDLNSTMLDLGCGSGRHSRQLAAKGYTVTGADLALQSIRAAKKMETANLRFYQQDMRKPFGDHCYDYVFNFFTSFGYFKNEEENHQVINNIHRSLKPGGIFLIDYMNIYHAASRLVPLEEKEIDGIRYHITRWTSPTHFYKKIVIDDMLAGKPFEYTEQVARFDLADFYDLLIPANLEILKVYGDYELNGFNAYSSPRLIILAQKKDAL